MERLTSSSASTWAAVPIHSSALLLVTRPPNSSGSLPNATTYRLVTTFPLTQIRKAELARLLAPWVTRDDQVSGADDLELWLNEHSRVERAHVKLWLSGSAQLDAQLHAETWARSRQLYEEIQLALPRYVETGSFRKARRRLRKDHVLVVSGPPGIGKTTLAQMLLADAAAEGFDAIEVSSDIEEAYKVVNVHSPQVFYYDDFLGSTFLEDRLAKNEDKRLSSFVRLCSENDRTFFVLTTREHILRQAESVYEAFDRQGFSLYRFLLTLPDFTRLERARIFYNHAWHSRQLSSTARRQLSRRQDYARIIDHPNYSPRLIEYITGLLQHRITPAENADYVSFAVDVLNTPDLIWRHAFERQLSASDRDTLVALASMPTETAVDDLEEAFTAVSCAGGNTLGPGAFRSSLRVLLDDCFTRSREQSKAILVRVADPSIEDFVASWLAANGEPSLTAIEGAAFFEQLQWLSTRVAEAVPATLRKRLRSALADAVVRCWTSRHPGWHLVYYNDDVKPTMSRQDASTAERLVFVNGLVDAAPFYAERLGEWLDERLAELPDEWKRRVGHAGKIVALVRALHESDRLPAGLAAGAVTALRDDPYAYAWRCLLDLRETVPDHFDSVDDVGLGQEYGEWVSRELRDRLDGIYSTEELEEMRRIADEFGASLDEELYSAAHEEVAGREVRRDYDSDLDDDREPPDRSSASNVENRRIDALFWRLSEDWPQPGPSET